MKNSSKYRVPPLKRTRDSFIDDRNSIENPRIDLGHDRHTQIRRDKDTIKSIGVRLYDIDYAVKSFVETQMQLKVEDNGEQIDVPILYANAEKWASIRKNGYLKDKKGKTLAPLITFRRSGVQMNPTLRRNKVATTNQLQYVTGQKYNTTQPYDRFSLMNQTTRQREYFITPIPDYVDVTYDFILWCDYQVQLNSVIEQFIWYTGQSFGDRNWFKFSTNMESVTMEDTNTTGQDRLVRATFQMTVHGYILPQNVAGEVTTRRIVTPNKLSFTGEAYCDISGIVLPFKPLNVNAVNELREYERGMGEECVGDQIPRSPDVYPLENQ